MMRRMLLALVCCLLLAVPAQAQPSLRLVAGTTMLADILTDLCPKAKVRTLIPGGACPGHYDLRASDMTMLAEADALFLHPWQPGLENIRALVDAVSNPRLRTMVVSEPGNAMVPEVHARYVRAMAAMLAELAPQWRKEVEVAAQDRLKRVAALDARLSTRLREAGATRTPVVCAAMLRSMVDWAGFPVAVDFSRPGDMTPEQMAAVMDQGRSGGAGLVVDNLQSGDGGRGVAEELDAQRVVLSNFPGGFPGIKTWEATMEANVRRLLDACAAAGCGS